MATLPGRSPKESEEESFKTSMFHRPQGAPRGLLVHYVLHRIAQKPAHGYEILQDIESKTEGAWRPGAGSIYPMLKKMVAEGLITEESTGKERVDHRTYHITKKGLEHVKMARQFFSNMGQRWSVMRRIFVEMLEPEDVGKFLVDGSKSQFQTAQEAVESKMENLSSSDARFFLKEYTLNLERQLDWANMMLKKLGSGEERIRPLQTASRRSRGSSK